MSMEYRQDRLDKIKGLRELADWLEANPTAPTPSTIDAWVYPAIHPEYQDDPRKAFEGHAKAAGKLTKAAGESLLTTSEFPGGVEYQVWMADSPICRKVLVREDEVEIPAVPASTRKVPVYEYDCEPILHGSAVERNA